MSKGTKHGPWVRRYRCERCGDHHGAQAQFLGCCPSCGHGHPIHPISFWGEWVPMRRVMTRGWVLWRHLRWEGQDEPATPTEPPQRGDGEHAAIEGSEDHHA